MNRRHQVQRAIEGAWSSWSSGKDRFLSTLGSSFFRICALDIIGERNQTFLILHLIPLDGLGIPFEGASSLPKPGRPSLLPISYVKNYHDCMLKCSPRSVLDLFFVQAKTVIPWMVTSTFPFISISSLLIAL